jgi:hypothetical protein
MNTFRGPHGKTIVRMDILPPDTRPKRASRPFPQSGEVVDAHYVAIQERRRQPRSQRSHNDNFTSVPAGESLGLTARVAGRIEAGLRKMPADLFSALVAAAFVAVFALSGGFSFLFQNAAADSSEMAWDITHVSMIPQDANGMRVLLINGIVENRGSVERVMPSIRAELMSSDVLVASTMINPPQGMLGSRQSRGFSARIPHPVGKLPDLRLSVAERGVSGS